MQDPTLILRDIHQPPAPSWWPPAPGWWILAAALLAFALLAGLWHRSRARQRRATIAIFDDALARAPTPPEQIAAMSELLRRAARSRDAAANTLEGEAWLGLLDADDPRRPFSQGPGRLLLEAGFQREADPHQVMELHRIARERFIEWTTR